MRRRLLASINKYFIEVEGLQLLKKTTQVLGQDTGKFTLIYM